MKPGDNKWAFQEFSCNVINHRSLRFSYGQNHIRMVANPVLLAACVQNPATVNWTCMKRRNVVPALVVAVN